MISLIPAKRPSSQQSWTEPRADCECRLPADHALHLPSQVGRLKGFVKEPSEKDRWLEGSRPEESLLTTFSHFAVSQSSHEKSPLSTAGYDPCPVLLGKKPSTGSGCPGQDWKRVPPRPHPQ